MKKIMGVVLVCLLAIGVSSLARAEETNFAKTGKENMKEDKEYCKLKHGDKKMKGHGKMMGHEKMDYKTMDKNLVATPDGGVIVLSGNKLQKYDKDLVLVKEVEIKPDVESMKKMMMEKKSKCPMAEGMMMGETETAGAVPKGPESATKSK